MAGRRLRIGCAKFRWKLSWETFISIFPWFWDFSESHLNTENLQNCLFALVASKLILGGPRLLPKYNENRHKFINVKSQNLENEKCGKTPAKQSSRLVWLEILSTWVAFQFVTKRILWFPWMIQAYPWICIGYILGHSMDTHGYPCIIHG